MMDLDIPDRLIPVRDKIDKFVRELIDPVTEEYYEQISVGDRWALNDRQTEILDRLKDKAPEAGLWNFFLPESQGGAGKYVANRAAGVRQCVAGRGRPDKVLRAWDSRKKFSAIGHGQYKAIRAGPAPHLEGGENHC